MASGDIIRYSDIPQMVKRGNRPSNKVIATTETGVLRVDAIPVLAGHAYEISVPRLRVSFVAAADRVKFVLRGSTTGAATTSSALIARCEQTDRNSTALIGYWFAGANATLSVILSGIEYSGSSVATLQGVDEGGIDMVIMDLGLDAGDSGVDL